MTLVSLDALTHRRRRFGIPQTVAGLRQRSQILNKYFFGENKTFAVVRDTGTPHKLEAPVLRRVRDELAILALSQLGYAHRRWMAVPSIVGERPVVRRSYLAIDSATGDYTQPTATVGAFATLALNAQWLRFQRRGFFYNLLPILRGHPRLTKEWRADLWNAAVLMGLSQTSFDVPQAFLWNMIALEVLLTRQGDTHTDALPARAEALLGWVWEWKASNVDEQIRDAYLKRCLLVHRGQREVIAPKDLLLTDDLVLNLLWNIVAHINLFPSKDAIIDFSRRVEAERTLGVKPRVRPKTLTFLKPSYRDEDYRLG